MSRFNWDPLLRRWSQEMLESLRDRPEALPPAIARAVPPWLGYPGATEAQIIQAETRLGITLPPSYRAFLRVTNGWQRTTPFVPRLWAVEDIAWFSMRHQDWIDAFVERYRESQAANLTAATQIPSIPDADYFIYGAEQDCSQVRLEYLPNTLEISQKGDSSIYLLNPQVIAADGEWEAWFFGDWLPGADRYKSFWDLMQAEFRNFLELREARSEDP